MDAIRHFPFQCFLYIEPVDRTPTVRAHNVTDCPYDNNVHVFRQRFYG